MGAALGSACSAYMAIFGKRNGLRALVNSRYVFGYYGAMVMSALNILTEVVFGVLACIQGGQTLASISSGKLPTGWGIVIVGIVSFLIATAGFKYVHYYER
jgi:purine-cytosine permease-like protein